MMTDEQRAAIRRHAQSLAEKPHVPWTSEGDRNCLSHWFPLIEAAGVPVPKTHITKIDDGAYLGAFMDGKRPEWDGFDAFIEVLRGFGDAVGWPCFLRTGQFSGKHWWRDCCFVVSPDAMERHVAHLTHNSHLVDFMGLAHDVWVVRELLPTRAAFRCESYGGFPAVREFRVFVEDARVLYVAPYWPDGAIENGKPDDPEWRAKLPLIQAATESELGRIRELASACGAAVGGRWSVDVLDTERGWFVTDMAIAERSYGWDESQIEAGDAVLGRGA